MTYTGVVETSGQSSSDTSISRATTAAIPASARTEAATLTPSGAVNVIASDSAKVSLAGAMLSQASTGSDVRFDKVAALQQSIGAGTYGVTSTNIAGKLIDSLQK
jgi:negative regulator of flagellin synthesis FlgM